MKRSRASYEAVSPPAIDYRLQYPAIAAIQDHLLATGQTSNFGDYFDDALGLPQHLDPLQQFIGSGGIYDAPANTSNQYDFASSCVDGQRNVLQPQQSPVQHSEGVRRGIVSHAECAGLVGTTTSCYPGAVASPYNSHRRSYSFASQKSALTPMPTLPAATAESTEARPRLYSSYRGLFTNSDAARDHRHISTRFGRQPYILPQDDDTIGQVERDRSVHVGRIYDAMVCGDRAQDNPGSIAMKRWVTGAHYKPDLVEAFAHKVFDCLLVQVKEGFRGWHHNDYVDDDRKGEKEDREADCANRLENIIDALEREKTVCEDVVNSASQIRMFVNAPIAYAQRKFQNRQGNSKRGRTKDSPDANPRPTQRRRIGGRQNRSTATPDRPASRDTTPQFQMPASTGMPYYASGTSQQLMPNPVFTYSRPRQSLRSSALSTPQAPSGYRQATTTAPPVMAHAYASPATSTPQGVMSPPTLPTSRPYNAHPTPMPPAPMLPPQTPPIPSHHASSAPPTPEDAKYPLSPSSPAAWPAPDTFTTSICPPLDPSLLTSDLFTPAAWSDEPAPAAAGTDVVDHELPVPHVSLADIEYAPLQRIAETAGGDAFESLWNEIPGVQRFPFDGAAS